MGIKINIHPSGSKNRNFLWNRIYIVYSFHNDHAKKKEGLASHAFSAYSSHNMYTLPNNTSTYIKTPTTTVKLRGDSKCILTLVTPF